MEVVLYSPRPPDLVDPLELVIVIFQFPLIIIIIIISPLRTFS